MADLKLADNRLALGTVQFGLPYGVANKKGQINPEEARIILEKAWTAGVDTLDTAMDYGESELRLGGIGVKQWKIVTKLSPIPKDCTDLEAWVNRSVCASIEKLKVPQLQGLLLHQPQQLLCPQGKELFRVLKSIKDQGKIKKIGVSVYDTEELDALWPLYQLDLVQIPFNIFDRRLVSSGWLKKLHSAGTEVHVRSVFLQGLLLMSVTDRPKKFNRWQPLWDQWQNWLAKHETTPLNACLGFAFSHPEIDRVIVGVDSLAHLLEILDCIKVPVAIPPEDIRSIDKDLINPSCWSHF